MRAIVRFAVVAMSASGAVSASGCGSGAGAPDVDAAVDAPVDAAPWPQRWFDVAYDAAGYLSVAASDPARTACTYYSFLRSGCEEVVDARGCGQGPLAPWITTVRVRDGAQVLATSTPVDLWSGAYFGPAVLGGHEELVLELEASDGQRAEIPIPTRVVPPQPAITTARYDGLTLHVEWSATPAAASTMIETWGGIRGYRCHVAAPQAALDLPLRDAQQGTLYYVRTYAPAPPIATPLGEAMVWIGGSINAPFPPR